MYTILYLHVPADPTLMLKASYQAFPFFLFLKTQYAAITDTHGTLAERHPPQFPQTHYYYNYHYIIYIPPCYLPTCQCTPSPQQQKTQLPKNQTHPKTPSKWSMKLDIVTNLKTPPKKREKKKQPRKGKHQANPSGTQLEEPHKGCTLFEIAMKETEQLNNNNNNKKQNKKKKKKEWNMKEIWEKYEVRVCKEVKALFCGLSLSDWDPSEDFWVWNAKLSERERA